MAQTINDISEILKTIKDNTENNTKILDKSFSSINNKLDLISEDNTNTEFIQVYLAELKKAVEDKHNYTISVFNGIEKSFAQIAQNLTENAKITQVRELTDELKNSINEYFEKVLSQKEIIEKIDDRLEILKNDKTDKNEIVENISAVKTNILELNSLVNTSFENVISELQEKTSAILSLNLAEKNEELKEQIEALNTNLSSVISDVRSDIKNIADSDSSGDILLNIDEVSFKVDSLDEKFSETASGNYEKIKGLLSELSDALAKQNEDLINRNQTSHEEKITLIQEISSNITELNGLINAYNNDYKNLIEEKFLSLKDTVEQTGQNLNTSLSDSDTKINEKLTALDELNHGFEATLIDINVNLQNIIKNLMMMDTTEQNDIIKRELENIYMATNSIFASLKISDQKNEELADMINTLFSKDDYKELKSTFNEFLQKFDDRTSIVNFNFDDIKQKTENILSKIDTLDYSTGFENIALSIGDLKDTFENNSKMNYENLSQELLLLSERFQKCFENTNSERQKSVDEIKQNIDKIAGTIKFLNGNVSRESIDMLTNISSYLSNALNELEQKFNKQVNLNFDSIKDAISVIVSDLEAIKKDITEKNDSNTYNISSGFDTFRVSFDNLISSLEKLKSEFVNTAQDNVTKIIEKIDTSSENLNNVREGILIDNTNLLVGFQNNFNENIQNIENSISEKSEDFKSYIKEIDESLKDYIEGIKNVSAHADDKIPEKLANIEAVLTSCANEYDEKLSVLQSKISEYINKTEKLTDEKNISIANSLDEFNDIKSELENLSEILKANSDSSNEQLKQLTSYINLEIENIVNSITEINSSNNENFNSYFEKAISVIDDKFSKIDTVMGELKNISSPDSSNISENLSSLKQEINLINTDICNTLNDGAENIIKSFEPVKSGIESFLNNEFSGILDDVKAQIELSYKSIEDNVINGLEDNNASLYKLEDAYKDTLNKITEIESFLHEQNAENIELLKLAVENVNKNVEENSNNTNSFISDWRLEIDRISKQLSGINRTVNDSLALFAADIRKSVEEKINNFVENLKSHIDSSANNQEILSSITEINNEINGKLSTFLVEQSNKNANIEMFIKSEIEQLTSSLNDLLKEDLFKDFEGDIKKLIKDIKSEQGKYIEQAQTSLEALHQKLDILTADDEIFNTELSETIETLTDKIAVLAQENDIKDIKNLITEQKDYFDKLEVSQKNEMMIKCLDEILEKLSNLDLEKSSNDIKESVINTVVSVFEQMSFIEETEEIKDFVEEKTDELNRHINDVREQLKQITSNSNDSDYSYTLQDVESDIAKLRLALNEISNTSSKDDIDKLNQNIDKIAVTVKDIESSLTPDEFSDLKEEFDKLNEDIVSISSRTNKLLLNSDESYKALNDGLDKFNGMVSGLEEKLDYLDNKEITQRIEQEIDSVKSIVTTSLNSNKVLHQVMGYLGEWIDSASENLTSISERVSEIDEVKNMIYELKNDMPEKTLLLDELQIRFENQESRIDRLELKIEKVLAALSEKNNNVLNKKVDKIEKQISALGKNIEKLASYVDE